MTDLNGKVVIVTGASSGIGEATAEALANAGATVVGAARRADRLDTLQARITESGGTAAMHTCDVTVRAQVKAMVESTRDQFGRIDGLVNNAGIMPLAPMAKTRMDDWDQCIDINIKGLLYCIGHVLPIMLEQKSGHIINMSSVAGRRPFPAAAVYSGTKAAVHSISEGLRNELSSRGEKDGNQIRVTIIAPGITDTELTDSIYDEKTRAEVKDYFQSMRDPLRGKDIAQSIVYAMTAPPHVNVNEILVRPTAQAN